MRLTLLAIALYGCTAAHVEPGCTMQKTATVIIACSDKAKGGGDSVTVPMP